MRDWFNINNVASPQSRTKDAFSSTSAGQVQAPKLEQPQPPSVTVVAQRFQLTEDLLIETQLRCWQLAEQHDFQGSIRVTFTIEAPCEWQEVYSAAVAMGNVATAHAMGADPYAALQRALASF